MRTTKDERLAIRLTAPQKDRIERAAAAQGRSITEFTLEVLIDRAEDILADQPRFDVNQEQWLAFQAALAAPAAAPAPLVELLRRPSVFSK